MTNYDPLNSTTVSEGSFEIEGEDFAVRMFAEAVSTLQEKSRLSSILQVSFDEQRNKAIFQLNGEIASYLATDQGEVPFPWMNNILVTEIERINETKNMIESIVNFYLENTELLVSGTSLSETLED